MKEELIQKMSLADADLADVGQAHGEVLDRFLPAEGPRANVVGVATGVKWTDGQPTGRPAVLVLVTHKVNPDARWFQTANATWMILTAN